MLFKKTLGLSIAALLFRVLTSSADIDGREVYLTGENPHGWDGDALTNIVQNSSNVPETQEIVNWDNWFFIDNDFSGLDVDTNSFVNTFDSNGSRYNVKAFNESKGCTQDFETGVSGQSNSIPLQYGTNLVSTVVDGNFIYSLDPNLNLNAGEEEFHYFNPTNLGVVIGVIDRDWIDSDNDGLSDDKENYVVGTYTNVYDSDGDGQSDGEEYYTGSDPLNTNDTFGIDAISISNGYPVVEWDGKSNITYNVEKSTNLLEQNAGFTNVHSRTPLEDEVQKYADTNYTGNGFYRLKAEWDL